MSLLNEALRKKNNERQQIVGPLAAAMPKLGIKVSSSRRQQLWGVIGGAVLLTAVLYGAWLYRSTSSAPTLLARAVPSPMGAVQPKQEPPMEPESKDGPAAPSVALSVSPLPAADGPESATPALPSSPPKAKPAMPAKTVKPAPAKHETPDEALSVHRPAKRKITSANSPKAPASSRTSTTHASKTRPADAQRRLQADRLYDKARQYHRRNRLGQAIALYQEVIKIDPENFNARFNLGAAYLQTEAFTKAYYIMADLSLKEPGNQQVLLNLAVADIGRRRFNDALALLDKVTASPEPPLFEIALHKGIAYNQLNQPEEALEWYKHAEALRPEDPRLLFNLAVVSDQQHRYRAAIDYYRRHLDQSPEMDPAKEKQIRRRIRILRAYHAPQNPKESIPQ